MTLHDASKEFELDCKVRHLSPKTIDNYTKQLRYLENHLSIEFSILNIKDVKPAHIKSFMAMMDDAGRKSQYINDLLKVFKTFFTYLEAEGYPKAGIRDNSYKQCNPGRIAQSLLVGSAPKPLKARAEALWLCRFPASSDLLASPKMQKRKAPEPVRCIKQCLTQGPCYRS